MDVFRFKMMFDLILYEQFLNQFLLKNYGLFLLINFLTAKKSSLFLKSGNINTKELIPNNFYINKAYLYVGDVLNICTKVRFYVSFKTKAKYICLTKE